MRDREGVRARPSHVLRPLSPALSLAGGEGEVLPDRDRALPCTPSVARRRRAESRGDPDLDPDPDPDLDPGVDPVSWSLSGFVG